MHSFGRGDTDFRIYLALSSSAEYRENMLGLVRGIQDTGMDTVFICINQPSSHLAKVFDMQGIDTTRIRYIDAITQYAGGTIPEWSIHCRFVSKPGDLTALGIAVTEEMKNTNDQDTVMVLDSVNAMMVYCNSVDLMKFIHFFTGKLRIHNCYGVFFAVGKGLDPVLVSQFMAFTDSLIEFRAPDTE